MISSQLTPQSVTSSEKSDGTPWRGPLFVAGTWRSGTSLLYALLNKHPQIGLLYEGDLFLLWPMFWIARPGSRWLARWDFWNGALKRHELDPGRIAPKRSRLPSAIEKAYQEYARQKGATIWGEKSVHFHHSLPRLIRDFPDARFIFLWRDLAAICGSVIRAKNDFFLGRTRMTERTLGRYQALRVQCERLVSRGVPVHHIDYETLVKDPASVMADVCKFLDIPYVPSMASLEGSDRSAIYEGGHHTLVRSERIVSSLERTEVLSPQLKSKIERYRSMWRNTNGNGRVTLSATENGVPQKLSVRERLFDRALYRCLRTYDAMVLLIYCFAPFWLLKGYRAYKRRVLHQPSWEHSGSGK